MPVVTLAASRHQHVESGDPAGEENVTANVVTRNDELWRRRFPLPPVLQCLSCGPGCGRGRRSVLQPSGERTAGADQRNGANTTRADVRAVLHHTLRALGRESRDPGRT